ncbi:arginase [Micromonospora luteifusca]|uniref:Arginase n=1 Tax=Micromonospora luteifusca TaxID=709860 RepID=A0ABS2LQW9_9ACTN|nr:arginase family protein [Micromonospora luteifusca]MBM7490525.1 arginase [Micromonospora luteifusca]
MMRRIAVLDAPTNLGLRPPTSTSVPGCAKAPGALRDHDLLARLRARDAGCVTPARYDPGDWRPGDGVCHAREIADYSLALAERIGSIIDRGEFPVVLGGDCSVLLGSALAMHRLGEAVGGRIGLVFVDGHSDFRHPGNASYVGAAAGEDLALVTGRGQADLAALEGRRPYFRDIDVVVLGIRAQDEYRLDLQAAGITTRPVPALRAEGAARTAQWAHEQLADCAGYWVHIDVDVLDPAVMPAVDAPDPGGIAFAELEILLAGLVDTPHCLGVELTVFDPDYDPDGSYAAEIVNTVVAGLAPVTAPEAVPPRLLSARPTPSPRRGNGRTTSATERSNGPRGAPGDKSQYVEAAAPDFSVDAGPPADAELPGVRSVEQLGGSPGGRSVGPSGLRSVDPSGVRSVEQFGEPAADPSGERAAEPTGDVDAAGRLPLGGLAPAKSDPLGILGPVHSGPAGVAAAAEREPVGPPASAGPGLLRRPSPTAPDADHPDADTA